MEIEDTLTAEEWEQQYRLAVMALNGLVERMTEAFQAGRSEAEVFCATCKAIADITTDKNSLQMTFMTLAAAVTLAASHTHQKHTEKN